MQEPRDPDWPKIIGVATAVLALLTAGLGTMKAAFEYLKFKIESEPTKPVKPLPPDTDISEPTYKPDTSNRAASSGFENEPPVVQDITKTGNQNNNDPSGIAVDAASILAANDDFQDQARQQNIKIGLSFDEDISRRSATENRISGSWTVTISGRTFCQYTAPRQWYGLGGITDLDSAKYQAAKAGADLMIKYVRENTNSSFSHCDSKAR